MKLKLVNFGKSAVLAAGLAGASGLDCSAQIVIDSFDVGPFSRSADSSGTQTGLSASHVLGGERTTTISDPDAPRLSSVSLVLGNGYLEYQRLKNGQLDLDYHYLVTSPSGRMDPAVDLSAGGGNNALLLRIDAAPSNVEVVAIIEFRYTESGTSTVRSGILFGDGLNSSPTAPISIPFSNLTLVGTGNASDALAHVTGIRLTLPAGVDGYNGIGSYRFSSFEAVPEPEELAGAAGVGLLIFAAAKCRLGRRAA